ncbi:hypothetical protein R3P38DRAFT_3324899 [Favolaschia claudopus]|uniref:Uncharacterized protein n=1 Tax=Favolaschia claudopus TaxID=2862362 RepID=A0AAW0AHY1_9AGAR
MIDFRRTKYCRIVFSVHQTLARRLGVGCLVKKWLLLQVYRADSDNNPFVWPAGDAVVCTVFRSYSAATCIHTLWLNAVVSSEISPCLHARTSPTAVIDTFVGNLADSRAPGWLRSLETAVSFAHERAGFIGLFANVAMWSDNLRQENLSTAMIEWACAISTGTWAQSRQLGPSTPKKPTTPTNFKPVRPCPRHNIYSTCVTASLQGSPPCIMDNDYESEDEGEAFGDADSEDEMYGLKPLPALCVFT